MWTDAARKKAIETRKRNAALKNPNTGKSLSKAERVKHLAQAQKAGDHFEKHFKAHPEQYKLPAGASKPGEVKMTFKSKAGNEYYSAKNSKGVTKTGLSKAKAIAYSRS